MGKQNKVTNLFLKWAVKRYGTQGSPKGDFVYDAMHAAVVDKDFPAESDKSVILDYLYAQGACDDALDVFESLWAEYERRSIGCVSQSFKIRADLVNRLDAYREWTGVSKTFAVEKALEKYLDEVFPAGGGEG